MPDITQISNSANLFAQSGQKVVRNDNGGITATGSTDLEEAEELQQQFLQILITQLSNQNPLEPVDTTEFTNQLIQQSSLEQQIDTNLKLSNILDALNVSSSFSAFSYIGNDVEIATNMGALQNDSADWNYSLKGNASDVEIKIRNSSGQLVQKFDAGSQSSGTYNFSLAKDDTLVPVADGEVLYFSIQAKNQAGALVSTDIVTNVTVDSVETGSNGSITLRAGDLYFGANDIAKITASGGSVGNSAA